LNRRTRATAPPSLDDPLVFVKGTTVFAILLLLGGVSLAGLVGSVVVASRDGYRRLPKETFARTV